MPTKRNRKKPVKRKRNKMEEPKFDPVGDARRKRKERQQKIDNGKVLPANHTFKTAAGQVKKKGYRSTYLKDIAYALYCDGKKDEEIAATCGVAKITINMWKTKFHFVDRNRKRKRPEPHDQGERKKYDEIKKRSGAFFRNLQRVVSDAGGQTVGGNASRKSDNQPKRRKGNSASQVNSKTSTLPEEQQHFPEGTGNHINRSKGTKHGPEKS